jgi:cellulose synthase (UDP-forming)
MVLACAWIAYSHPGPLLVPCVLVVGAALVGVNKAGREEAIRMVLAIGVVVAGIDYISWRFVVINWSGWWIAVPLLAAETLGAIHVAGFQVTLWPWQSPKTQAVEDPTQHPIFILVPTLNEGVEVLRPTIEACLATRDRYVDRYPHARVRVIVCNDGRAAGFPEWKEVESLARSLGAACVSRRHPGGAKAGNIEHARRCFRISRDALVVIFDADQTPSPDFLLKTIPHFGDPNVGWVQTGQYYANRSNPVSRWADDQQSLFYNLLCPGKAAHNSAFICGTNVVIRASALDQIGGLPQDSVTEDFAASIALHPSWQGVYLTEVLATGIGPLDMPSYLKQQRRWAVGTLGVLRTNWRDIFLPKRHGGLKGSQRIQYFLACTHYLSGVRDLVYLICPMLFIATGVPAVRSASLGQYLSHFLPYGILSYSALWYAARGVTGLRGIVMSFGSFPTLVGSLLTVVRGRKASFAVTAKRRHAKQSLRYLRVYLLAAVACVATIIWATQVGARQQASMFISLWWVVYTLLMLAAFLWLAVKDLHIQVAQSRAESVETIDKVHYRSRLEHRPIGLRPVWNLAAAAVLATPLLLAGELKSAGIFRSDPPPPFAIRSGEPGTPYAGVSIPAQLVSAQTQIIQADLDGRAGVVGRTIDLSDRFPRVWADALASDGGRPWISLQFGEFGPGKTIPLDASLPSIINGVDDGALGRWASEIRSYGKPVYMTILTQVDRNWSVTSGVANGGIPEDVSKAWLHVQSLFRQHGARNVAWVWAPADPLHDQQFAPPAVSIDAVLQTFVNYPGTTWGQPSVALSQLQQRYPGKPIFVDVSVDGPSSMKASWLASLGRAIHNTRDVHAVLYHEGGPELSPTAEELKQWSAASDPSSLAAWHSDLAGLATATSQSESLHESVGASG